MRGDWQIMENDTITSSNDDWVHPLSLASEVASRLLADTKTTVDEQKRDEFLQLLYLSLLGFILVTPFLYFLQCFCGRRLRRQQMMGGLENEQNDTLAADSDLHRLEREQTQILDPELLTAECKFQYGVRILQLQLLDPVRTILTEEHFIVDHPTATPVNLSNTPDIELGEAFDSNCRHDSMVDLTKRETILQEQSSHVMVNDLSKSGYSKDESTVLVDDEEEEDDDGQEEESRLIRIPRPGLVWRDNFEGKPGFVEALKSTRIVPGFCTICLSGFHPGSEIVWSSNAECEHVFHHDCMEQWLMKLPCAEGPICPCCRRDFVVDSHNLCSLYPPGI